jgi:hypothetical protein
MLILGATAKRVRELGGGEYQHILTPPPDEIKQIIPPGVNRGTNTNLFRHPNEPQAPTRDRVIYNRVACSRESPSLGVANTNIPPRVAPPSESPSLGVANSNIPPRVAPPSESPSLGVANTKHLELANKKPPLQSGGSSTHIKRRGGRHRTRYNRALRGGEVFEVDGKSQPQTPNRKLPLFSFLLLFNFLLFTFTFLTPSSPIGILPKLCHWCRYRRSHLQKNNIFLLLYS